MLAPGSAVFHIRVPHPSRVLCGRVGDFDFPTLTAHLTGVRNFEILFDQAEASNSPDSAKQDPAYQQYGSLAFPALPSDHPWIYSYFHGPRGRAAQHSEAAAESEQPASSAAPV